MQHYIKGMATQKRALRTAVYRQKQAYVQSRLVELGLDAIEMHRSEALLLPSLLHENETIGGVVAGRGKQGHYMMVATNRRVIILDCKPLFKDVENIGYHVVAGVSIGSGLSYTVVLHTRLGDFKLKTLYGKAARSFEDYIEQRCTDQTGSSYDAEVYSD